ncbi:MAG: YCF48-related protein [Candidatus Marinimicrobia bacterium]|nr:YCF48-related protein [Candidatus Neomarinimicrobiota bacterium]
MGRRGLSLSTDGGASFSYPDNYVSETTDNIYELHFIDENTGLLGGGSGLLKKTTDGGATWVDIDNPMVQQTNKHIYAMHIASDGTIYAGGSSGIIMRSTNNGDTWEEVDNEASNTVYSITVLSNGLGFATMSRSTFAVSKTTALDSFKVVDPDFGYAVFRSVKERNGVVIVGGSDGVFRTTVDDLDTLYEVFTEPNDDDIYEVEFINDSTIYASGQNGIIYRSTDTGNTWEKMPSAAEDLGSTLSVLGYNGKKLFAAGQDGVVLSHEVLPAQADYTETFAGGAAELTWAENSTNANSGGVNLAVVADSAGLSNVGVYTDDENTGLLYAETDKALLNYEVSSDIYIVKEQSDTEALYKGLVIKCDPEEQLFYRFIYRNASSDNGILKLQGFDGASWYISKSFYPGVDFDTLATGFHNFKAQVVGNNIWVYIDDQLLPGCPYTHDGEPVVKNGYAGIYKYTGGPATVAFDNFNIDVYNYAQYGVTAHVNMSVQMRKGNFTHAGHSLDIVGSFNGWGAGLPMTDADGDSIYSAFLGEFEEGTTLEFKCRRNGAWDNTEEFPYGGGNRSYTVLAEEDQDIPVFYYNDETVVSVDGIPDAFSLSQNYPNPFNPATTVKFALPKSETVTLSIFNVAGQKVAELINKQMDAGFYTVKFDARSLPSGVYIYRLGAGEFTAVRKMTLVK